MFAGDSEEGGPSWEHTQWEQGAGRGSGGEGREGEGQGREGQGRERGAEGGEGGRGGEISEPLFLYRIYTKLLVMFTRLIAMNLSNLVITFLESNKQNYFHMHDITLWQQFGTCKEMSVYM